MISPGSSRAISAGNPARSHSAMRNSPVEMSIQASAKRSAFAEASADEPASAPNELRARATASR
jgi:hypothetical protein